MITLLGRVSRVILLSMLILSSAADGQERQFSEIPSILAVKRVEITDSDSELRRLVKERYNEAAAQVKDFYALYRGGRVPVNDISYAIEAFADAGEELAETPVARVSELELARDAAGAVEAITKRMVDSGQEIKIALQHVRICRLGLDIRLIRAREAAKAASDGK